MEDFEQTSIVQVGCDSPVLCIATVPATVLSTALSKERATCCLSEETWVLPR
jgi:hypothetical protein